MSTDRGYNGRLRFIRNLGRLSLGLEQIRKYNANRNCVYFIDVDGERYLVRSNRVVLTETRYVFADEEFRIGVWS